MKRTLTVKKEALTELTADELTGLVAGTRPVTITNCTACTTVPTMRCD